jgi:hypothetical protein
MPTATRTTTANVSANTTIHSTGNPGTRVPPEEDPLTSPPAPNLGEEGRETATGPEEPAAEEAQSVRPSEEPPKDETLDDDSEAGLEPRLSDADEDLTDDGENSSYGRGVPVRASEPPRAT